MKFYETKNRKSIFEIEFSKLQNKIRKRIAKFYETKNRKIDFLKTKPNICDFQNWNPKNKPLRNQNLKTDFRNPNPKSELIIQNSETRIKKS